MFNEIKSFVNPIYENVDALLLTESDYHILEQKGYMHPDKLGYFKIEHIITEIAISSQRKYVATFDDNTQHFHCVNSSKITYEDFVNEIKNQIHHSNIQ